MNQMLDADYEVADSQIQSFQRDGHVYLQQVADARVVPQYRNQIAHASLTYGQKDILPMEQRDTYGKAFLQHMNLWEFDDSVKEFVLAKRFAKIAADLLGVSGVRLYHDQALCKEGGGGRTPWHQDQYYWPIDSDKTITMWMPLVDIDASMGMLTFASESHLGGHLGTLPISDESEQVFNDYVAKKGFRISAQQKMQAGDATFHQGWTLHSAPGNQTDRNREVITIIYFADGARIKKPENENQQADLERWFPGLQPGELAASPINPVVWSA